VAVSVAPTVAGVASRFAAPTLAISLPVTVMLTVSSAPSVGSNFATARSSVHPVVASATVKVCGVVVRESAASTGTLSTPFHKYGDIPFEHRMRRPARKVHFTPTGLHGVAGGSAAAETPIENTSPYLRIGVLRRRPTMNESHVGSIPARAGTA
jgi:hypothetical protein